MLVFIGIQTLALLFVRLSVLLMHYTRFTNAPYLPSIGTHLTPLMLAQSD